MVRFTDCKFQPLCNPGTGCYREYETSYSANTHFNYTYKLCRSGLMLLFEHKLFLLR